MSQVSAAAQLRRGLQRIGRAIAVRAFLSIRVAICAAGSDGKEKSSVEGAGVVENNGTPVGVDGRPILLIYARIEDSLRKKGPRLLGNESSL
jgi:hypothetical protein